MVYAGWASFFGLSVMLQLSGHLRLTTHRTSRLRVSGAHGTTTRYGILIGMVWSLWYLVYSIWYAIYEGPTNNRFLESPFVLGPRTRMWDPHV